MAKGVASSRVALTSKEQTDENNNPKGRHSMEWVRERDQDVHLGGYHRLPIKSWCEPIEDGAMKQAVDVASHPTAWRHVALMPDCHQGYGMPIGGVIACKDVLIPNAVGVDIGCGMCAVPSSSRVGDIDEGKIKKIMGVIRKAVPVGFSHHQTDQSWEGFDRAPDLSVIQRELKAARKQLGTLGGGNHFIEIQAADTGVVWLMLHSGSRNFGYKIAKEYHDLAKALNAQYRSNIPNEDLAFLPVGTSPGQEYIYAMNYALEFAAENRRVMMEVAMSAMGPILGCDFGEPVNIHHNFAAQENHFGHNVWIHRKGATRARAGEFGLIPGSMGTPSYLVEGLGNMESFMSCSHGAGRVMGRAEASRRLTEEECNEAMEGIVFGRWGKARNGKPDFGEAPQAYKDIDVVIDAQRDLVRPLVQLRPLGVIKG